MMHLSTCLMLFAALFSVQACSDTRDKGERCDSATPGMKYFYDKKSGRCQTFYFLGCGGNSNRFNSASKCETRCVNAVPTQLRDQKPSNSSIVVCGLNTSAVLSTKAAKCSSDSNCESNFRCVEEHCCPTKEYICRLPVDSGNEKTDKVYLHKGRYAWQGLLNNCIRFSYFGQAGNLNNFASYNDCVAFCRS